MGTYRTMDILEEHGFDPARCVIDHNNEETVEEVLDRGYWAAFTIYPHTKMGSARMVEVVKRYGPERIIVDSAADWGVSDPLAVPKTAELMRSSGVPAEVIGAVTYGNALAAYGQSGQMAAADWLEPPAGRPADAVRGEQRAPRRPGAADRSGEEAGPGGVTRLVVRGFSLARERSERDRVRVARDRIFALQPRPRAQRAGEGPRLISLADARGEG